MKLGALKTAIRDHKGSVLAWSNIMDSWIVQGKGSFLEALDHRFQKQRNCETGMMLDAEGKIVRDVDATV